MKIAITGSSGLVGSALTSKLSQNNHQIIRLVRSPPTAPDQIQWNPTGPMPPESLSKLNGIDTIIHLAGENIAGGRWTPSQMKKLYDSRVIATKYLVADILKLDQKPQTVIVASAIGYYGPHQSETITEESPNGTGFLADLCFHWEKETKPLAQNNIRTVNTRFGIILSPKGGALKKMLLPFKLGLGGPIGSGKQYYSWISLDDCVSAINFIIDNKNATGPINLTAPNPVTNHDFTKILGKALHRPTIFPMPAFAARLAFSPKLAQETIITGQNVIPRKLQSLNYQFQHPTLETALAHLL